MASLPYYTITPCCPELGTQLSNFRIPGGTLASGSYVYKGANTSSNGIIFKKDSCYTITNEGTSSGPLPNAPSAVDFSVNAGCLDEKCNPCSVCYTLVNCFPQVPIIISNTIDLEDYVGTYIKLFDDNLCYYVIKNENTNCPGAVEVNLNPELPCTQCVPKCWYVTGNPTSVTYVTIENEVINTSGNIKVCSIIPPVVTGTQGSIINIGDCIDGECPELCFELENCVTNEIIYSKTETLIQYIDNTVTLNGEDGCWQVTLTEGDCDCPIPVTVLQSFDDCPSCLPIVAYKFTNCNNQILVQYSTEDYSEYVGKTVELECGDCWFVSQIDYTPPSTQTITILYTFDNCAACAKTYYELTNCLNETQLIYTSSTITLNPIDPTNCDCIKVTWVINNQTVILETLYQASVPGYLFSLGGIQIFKIIWNDDTEVWDLFFGTIINVELIGTLDNSSNCPFGNFVINSTGIEENITSLFVEPCTPDTIISIKECAGCWIVKETREPINPGVVEVTETYIDCPECLVTFPCVCNRITNQDTIAKDFIYLDCLFEEVTINLQPNETSDKVCLVNWVLTPEEEALVYIEHFGNCNGGNVCYEYDITIGSNTTAALYYKNCSGAVESQQTNSQKSPYTITICGINNQTSSDIYIVGTGSISFEKTTICDTQPFTCPVEPLPKRKVKPGYSTPSCDIEKYEKITCKASEIYYKQVMRLRYGISNCCPEEEEKWLIKKELIDLVALIDPDYICTPVTSCCGQTLTSCGCGCNQTLKTCNSQ